MPKPDSTPNYRLNCGQYVLHRGDTPVGAVLDEVALAISRDGPMLHKHGAPAMVTQWADQARARMRGAGGELGRQMAEDLIVLTGRFPLEELNRLLSSSTYAARFLEKLERCQIPPQPLLAAG